MKGRKPKPTAFRLIEGNREHRTIDADHEPKPEKKAPPCPGELHGDEKRAWGYLVRELDKMNTLATSDRGMITGYCHAWGTWVKAKRKLNELAAAGNPDPEVIMTEKGNWIQNPWLGIANRAMADVVKYGSFLGLDPTSRTRIKVEQPQKQSLRDELLA
jgi:P27 family predicted phage terminase small subunit